MRCPKCGFRDDKVIDSRQSRDSSSIRRRRVCLQCAYRFTTYEQIERSDLRRDYLQHDAAHHALIGERTGKRFRLADRMSVKLVRVDLDQRKIDLVPA